MMCDDVKVPLRELNGFDQSAFVRVCGPLFEHSPWIAERAWSKRPFASVEELHAALVATVEGAGADERIALIAAHPDLVGRMAREGRLTRESTGEQSVAGLTDLTADESRRFDEYNADYRARFGFPFVICARENKKQSILNAFPARLAHDRSTEIDAAISEIAKIARLRLIDRVGQD